MKRFTIVCVLIYFITRLYAIDYVAITEIMYDTPCHDSPSRRINCEGEFIELYNLHNKPANVGGWSVEMLDPRQTYKLPQGTIIAPRSALIIAFYDSQTPWDTVIVSEYQAFKEYFQWLYNIKDIGSFTFLCQDSLILPNANTTLILKDSIGQTRDSVRYGFTGSRLWASNEDTNSEEEGFMEHIYSLQRKEITFNKYGCAQFYDLEWLNWNKGSYYSEQVNTVGILTKDFLGCNIIPITDKDKIDSCNYILETTPRLGVTRIDSTLHDPSKTTRTRTYYDPMYRPTMTIKLNYTPGQNHQATLIEYDTYGRLYKEWLPIPIEWEYLTNEIFKNNARQYYDIDSRPFVEHTYSTTKWDNGIIKNELVGTQKAGSDMGTHKVSFYSRGNDSAEVRLFRVTSEGLLDYRGIYQDSMLRVTQTADEDNKTKLVYTNSREQVVMEKVGDAATYYVYNDFNRLCYVLPPLATSQIDVGIYSDTTDVLKKYAYVYKYDKRGNQIYKRLPGCEPILMVYDKSNSLVMSQTGNQRSQDGTWTMYEYDLLRRLIYTAEVIIARENHEQLIEKYSKEIIGESFSVDFPRGYSHNFLPHVKTSLTVNYYDDYQHLALIANNNMRRSMIFSAFEDNDTCANPKGLLTGTRTYYLDGSEDYSETVYYYDYRGREIQRRTTNHLGGYDVVSTKYDFVNNITNTWSSQSTNNGLIITEHYHYTYDHANRLLTTTYTFNNESPIVLQSYHYDELGRVRSRHIHNGIDSMAFNYDIRNQVTQIKSSCYEQKYYYNQSCPIAPDFSGGLYNGNISATTWTYGNQTNGYVYRYDKMNRLESNYSILNGSLNVDCLYSESFSYDAQGNVTNLTRWDNNDLMNYLQLTYDGNQLVNVDDNGLGSYEYATKQYHDNNYNSNDFAYDANGNMLYDKDRGIAAICYNLLNLPDTILFTNGNQIVHFYDAAGNRLKTNYYTRKVAPTIPLENTVKSPNSSDYYITNDVYNRHVVYNSKSFSEYGIEFVHNPEGYIRYYGPEEHYHFYYIKDLLGNIRETYVHPEAGYKECIQRMQYYPSGLPWLEAYSPSEQPYKYNGKEFVEMHGLDEYDSKARWYYPAICRTTTMDPLAETYYDTSPYVWCGNNPVRFVDPDGKRSKMIESDNILTFQAVYYTHPADVKSAQQAIDFWNNQKDLQYTDMRGNNYSVMFDLSLKVVENPLTEASLTGKNTNSYQVLPRLSKVSPNPQAITTGLTNENYKIEVRLDRADGLTGAHEVGHTLIQPNEDFSEHSTSGIMTENAKDPQHGAFVSQETVDEIVESHQNKNLWSKIESLFK